MCSDSLIGARRPHQNSELATIKVMFLNQPIYCEKSDRDPNPHHLRVLAKEENDRNDRQAKSSAKSTTAPAPDVLLIIFDCSSVSCGVWRLAMRLHPQPD